MKNSNIRTSDMYCRNLITNKLYSSNMEEILKKRGPYTLDLTRQVKVRVNDITFEKLIKISEENNRPISSIIRGMIFNRLNQDRPTKTF